jgi:hypothetical protein
MNTLHTLRDAFEKLEERADAAHVVPPDFTVRPAGRPHRSNLARYGAPAAAAAAVVAVAGGVTLWQHGHGGAIAHQPAADGSTSVAPSTPARSTPKRPARYVPPSTVGQLEAKTRAILGRLATITVDPNRSTDCGATQISLPPAPGKVTVRLPNGATTSVPTVPSLAPNSDCSGAALGGSLTSAGRTGGFDLDVFTASPGSTARCDESTTCITRRLANGSTVATSTWADGSVPGGVTYQVEVVRPDGADVLMHLSTETNPKGESSVSSSQVPLTLAQMTTFAASDRW